jgi:hypothetical protein
MVGDHGAPAPRDRSLPGLWKLAAVLPALLLVAVALHQIYLVRTADLTPWKGGGFGMFASTDGLPQRTVLVFASASERSEELTIPDELKSVAAKAAALPGDRQLERLARSLAQRERDAGRPLASLDLVVQRTRYSRLTLFATTETLREYTFVVDEGG